jgi:DNA helicase II / ATP-dependent DNA helicase PcrA
MTFDQRYKKLNKQQRKAVDTIEGPLLVVAGPGSGKTEILSLRVASILQKTHALPSNILCLTFTDSAAVNMRNRLSGLIGQSAYKVSIHTFHNFAVDCIQRYPEFFYKGAVFTPIDPITQISMLQKMFEDLDEDNPLRVFHPDQGWIYLKDTLSIIANLKKAGISPSEFRQILTRNKKDLELINEILVPIMDKTVSKKVIEELYQAKDKLSNISSDNRDTDIFDKIGINSALYAISLSLEEVLIKCEESGKNEPLTKWKQKWFKKDDDNKRFFKDLFSVEKLDVVAGLYERYRQDMHDQALFDFDDMILDLVSAIENNPRLKNELQEQYQYILVDEFQDTNNAQMRIIRLIADSPVNEGRPNVMVVGDDDQAVYKFQGAELSNILNFKTMFADVEVVNMTENYRSTQDVLDIATHIIRKGEHRLENLIPQLEKTLISSNPEIGDGSIVHKIFDTSLHEFHYISRRIKKLIDSGIKPSDIAVISKKHRQLEDLVPYMKGAGVPIKYEREQNVLNEPHIVQLILLSRFVISLADKNISEADDLLPKILAFPFWQLPRASIWKISRESYESRKSWLETMLESKESSISNLAKFFISLGEMCAVTPLEQMLDLMIGAHVHILSENEDDDDEVEYQEDIGYFKSPFKKYYFSREKFDHARAEYISFLSSLRVFIQSLREYKGGYNAKKSMLDILTLSDLVEFVDIHKSNSMPLNDQSPFVNSRDAVNLLSAHKSKGLEFDTVFVISATDDVWAGKGLTKKISLPVNMPIEPAGDSDDDKLRLFYVAITRAKKNLYITSHKVKDDGKESSTLRFLTSDQGVEGGILQKLYIPEIGDEEIFNQNYTPETHDVLTASWLLYHTPPFIDQESALLKSLLENYQLSVTHLSNYLNVGKGGPQVFLEQNLLRFPQAKTPSGAYGTAVHSVLEKTLHHFKNTGSVPEKDTVLSWFSQFMSRERLSTRDQDLFTKKGIRALSAFYENRISDIKIDDISELNFKHQGVFIVSKDVGIKGQDCHLTGKIDRVERKDGTDLVVHDYKTGNSFISWNTNDKYESMKSYEYSRQLYFYKILIENSKDYSTYDVKNGIIDFIEPDKKGKNIELTLNLEQDSYERFKKLAFIVYNKIINLDFPELSNKYTDDVKGIIQFEDDLLASSQ